MVISVSFLLYQFVVCFLCWSQYAEPNGWPVSRNRYLLVAWCQWHGL